MARDNGVSTYDNITDTYEILGSLPEIEVYGHKKSAGGPLYPFSFEKMPFLKTPIVRYDDGGLLTNWEQGALDRATEVYSNYE
jgi:hypothetical protein